MYIYICFQNWFLCIFFILRTHIGARAGPQGGIVSGFGSGNMVESICVFSLKKMLGAPGVHGRRDGRLTGIFVLFFVFFVTERLQQFKRFDVWLVLQVS